MKYGVFKEEFKPYFQNRETLEAAGVVPKMYACEFHASNEGYKYYIAMEKVLVLENQDGLNLAFPSMTPIQSRSKF